VSLLRRDEALTGLPHGTPQAAAAGPARCVGLAAGLAKRAAGASGGIPASQNHNSGPIAMHPLHVSHATKGQ